MTTQLLLEAHVTTLRLTGIRQHYRRYAEDAARTNQGYEQYLPALVEQEVARRAQVRQERAIRAARLPLLKELAEFDFQRVPHLNKALVLELAQGHYLERTESILLVGNPGLGKTHIATSLAHEQQWNKNERYGNISQSPAATPNMCVFQRGSRTRSCAEL